MVNKNVIVDDDDDDLLLANNDDNDEDTESQLNSKLSAKANDFSIERKKNDNNNKKNEYLNETRFNKSNNFSLLNDNTSINISKRRENKNNQKSSLNNNLPTLNATNNSNLLVDIGLFADLGETDDNNTRSDLSSSSYLNKTNTKSKHINRVDYFQQTNMNNNNNDFITSDSTMNGLNNPNFNQSDDNIEIANLPPSLPQNDHCHPLDEIDTLEDISRNTTVWRKLITVLILCVLFMIGEIVGGILAGSISIQTDAAHMAADIFGFLFSIVAIYVSGKSIFF